MASADAALRDFVSKQKGLLDAELRAEDVAGGGNAAQADHGSRDGGFYLRDLAATDIAVGLYGRTLVTFGNDARDTKHDAAADDDQPRAPSSRALLPAHRLTVGDEVQVFPNNGRRERSGGKSRQVGGVICAADDVGISVALFGGGKHGPPTSGNDSTKKRGKKSRTEHERGAEDGEEGDVLGGRPPYALLPAASVAVHDKMRAALDALARHGVAHPVAGAIVRAAFAPPPPARATETTTALNADAARARADAGAEPGRRAATRLNAGQREAVAMALRVTSPVTLIHGPPGTGASVPWLPCSQKTRRWGAREARALGRAQAGGATEGATEKRATLRASCFCQLLERSRKICSDFELTGENQRPSTYKCLRLAFHSGKVSHRFAPSFEYKARPRRWRN